MPSPRRPSAVAATRPALGSASAGLWSVGWAWCWVLLFLVLFFSARLTNNPGEDRLSLLLLAPERLTAPFFPPAGQARVLAWGHLSDRWDLLLVAGVLWSAAWGWGHLGLAGSRRDLSGLTPAERHWLALALGGLGISLGTLLLGLAGVLQPQVFRVLAGLGIAGGLATWQRGLGRQAPSPGQVRDDSTPGPPAAGPGASAAGGVTPDRGWHKHWWLLAAVPFVVVQFLGALLPSSDFDVNEYHFGGPKEWFQAGQIVWLPHNVYTSFPFGTEMLTLAGMVLHGDWYRGAVAGKTALCGLGLHTAAGLYFAGRRWFGTPAGACGGLLWLSQPWTYRIGSIAYAEGGLCAAVAGGLWVLSLRHRSPTPAVAAEPVAGPTVTERTPRSVAPPTDPPRAPHRPSESLALPGHSTDSRSTGSRWPGWHGTGWLGLGLAAGWGMACKYPGLISTVIPLGTACLWLAARDALSGQRSGGPESAGRPGWVAGLWQGVCWYGCGVALVAGPWLLKNWWETGNPVYPLGWTWLGGADWDADLNTRWRAAHSSSDFRPVSLLNLACDIALRNDWVSPAIGALAPLACLSSRGRTVTLWLVVYLTWLFLTVWAFTHRLDRFWVPLLPVATLLAGRGADALWSACCRPGLPLTSLPRGPQLARGVLTCLAALCGVYCLTLCVSPLGGNNAFLMKFPDAAATVANLTAPELVTLNEQLPPGSRVLAVGDAEMFEARFPVAYNTVFDHCLLEQWLSVPAETGEHGPGGPRRVWRSAAEVKAELSRRGITHIYVNWLEILRYRSPGNYGYTAFIEPRRFDELRQLGVIGAGWNLPTARLPWDRLDAGRQSIVESWGRRPLMRAGGEESLVTFEVFPVLP